MTTARVFEVVMTSEEVYEIAAIKAQIASLQSQAEALQDELLTIDFLRASRDGNNLAVEPSFAKIAKSEVNEFIADKVKPVPYGDRAEMLTTAQKLFFTQLNGINQATMQEQQRLSTLPAGGDSRPNTTRMALTKG